MTIKQLGGVFGRNPTFNDVTIESDLNIGDKLGVNIGTDTPTTYVEVRTDGATGDDDFVNLTRQTYGNVLSLSRSSGDAVIKSDKNLILRCDSGNNQTGANTNIIFQYDGSTESARFNSAGNLAFTSGKGIDFSATAGTGTSELLDDYEEGAWTPLISQDGDGAVPFTSVTQSGAYTKVGNLVTVTCLYEYSGIGSVGNNFAYMGGLPFTAADNSIYGYGFSFFEQSAYDTKSYSIAALSNAAKAFFQYDNGGGTLYVGTPRMVGNSFPSAAKVRFTLTYIAV